MAYDWKIWTGSVKTDAWAWCTPNDKEWYSDAFVFYPGRQCTDVWMLLFFRKKGWKTVLDIYAALYDIQYLEFSVLFFTAAGGSRICNAGTYQALAVYYIAVCVMFFLLFFWQVNGKREKCGIRIIFLVAHFGISYLIYRGIAGTWFMAAGDYMEGQSNWGSEPAAECVKNVLRVVKNQLLTVGPRNFSFYVIGVLLAFYVIWIAWTRRTESGRAGFWIFAAGMIFMLITPFLMTIYAGAMLVTRTQFALPVVAAFLAMFGVMILKEQQISDVRPEKQERDRKMCRWLQVMGNVVILLVIAVTGGQVCYNIRMHSADQVRYEQDALLADQITDALKREIPGGDAEGDPVDKKVVFIGYRQPQLNSLNRRTEMYGWSFFEWDYTREHPAGATHRIAGFLEAHIPKRWNIRRQHYRKI